MQHKDASCGHPPEHHQALPQVGDRAFNPARHHEVTIDDVCGDRVRCVWEQDGIRRSAWVAPHQLEGTGGPKPA